MKTSVFIMEVIMDEMNINLRTRLMRSLVEKIIKKLLKKRFGYEIDIHFEELELSLENGTAKVHTNIDLEMNANEFKKLIKEIGKEKEL